MRRLFPIVVILWLGYLAFFSSCANIGMPSGGPKDTIPPVLIHSTPKNLQTNFQADEARLTFNEYVVYDQLGEKLVVSPPMKKKPVFKTKGKTLMVEFKEPLKGNTTYSLDFRDAVADNNEKNAIQNLRISFSTGNKIDTLQLGGYVRRAFDLEPVENALVVLNRNQDSKAFTDSVPAYIAKTNKEGYFEVKNIAAGHYRLYAILDTDNSMTYNQKGELIAFDDSTIIPSAQFFERKDTIVKDGDTLAVSGHVVFYPGLQYLRMFEEEKYDQYLKSHSRPAPNKCTFVFNESLTDSFKIKLLKPEVKTDWSFVETNLKRDSITLWVTDTLLTAVDTLKLSLRYQGKDSLNHWIMKQDTLPMVFTLSKAELRAKKRQKEVQVPQINLTHNLVSKGFDIYRKIIIQAPEPLKYFDPDKVHLYQIVDSTKENIPVTLKQDSASIRRYFIDYAWDPEQTYQLVVDSAAAKNIYGHPSGKIAQKFEIQEERYYGKIIVDVANVHPQAIIQLLDNSKEEKVLQTKILQKDGTVIFEYLKPEKYKLKVIFDDNQNGKWDTGLLHEGIQPERVAYFNKVLKVRSNFEYNETWNLKEDAIPNKDVFDEEKLKEDKKKQTETTIPENKPDRSLLPSGGGFKRDPGR